MVLYNKLALLSLLALSTLLALTTLHTLPINILQNKSTNLILILYSKVHKIKKLYLG